MFGGSPDRVLETIVDGQTRYRKAEETQWREVRSIPQAPHGPEWKPATAPSVAAPRKQRPPEWQEQLFFQRLRVHAKWAFVLLALVFGLGFVFLGIGSGSNGITDALQNAFNFGKSGGGASISSLERKTQKNPLDAQAWRDLATAYETKQRTSDAIIALSQYVGLRSKDADALAELATEYGQQANQYAQDYQATLGPPRPHTAVRRLPTGCVLTVREGAPAEGAPGPDLRIAARTGTGDHRPLSELPDSPGQRRADLPELAKLTPKDPNAQYQLAQSADAAGDTKVAVAAYKAVIKLVPATTDPLRVNAEQRLKALTPAAKK